MLSLLKHIIMTNNLKQYLEDNKISAYSLATKMGISNQRVHYYKNAGNLSPSVMTTIAKALEVDVNKLFQL